MIVYPYEWSARKEAVFSALAQVAGGGRILPVLGWSGEDYPDTCARVDIALARAKRQPASKLGRRFKRWLIRGQYNWARRYFSSHPDRVAVAWNGLTGSRMAFLAAARDAGAACLYLELAPLPGRVTLDVTGVNAESSVPRTPDFFQTWAGVDPGRNGDAWRELGKKLVARAPRRTDVGQKQGAGLPQEPFLFCPLQVPGDSQVTLFPGWCGGLEGFINAVGHAAESLPAGWHLRIKEHPSARRSLRREIERWQQTGRVVLDNDTETFAQVAASRGVVTLNSSVGLQAFFHDKPVVVLGQCFFAQPELVALADGPERLAEIFAHPERLTVDLASRNRFMNWLDQEYYPPMPVRGAPLDGVLRAAFGGKFEEARRLAKLGSSGVQEA